MPRSHVALHEPRSHARVAVPPRRARLREHFLVWTGLERTADRSRDMLEPAAGIVMGVLLGLTLWLAVLVPL
jgi:hypothetical protein